MAGQQLDKEFFDIHRNTLLEHLVKLLGFSLTLIDLDLD